MLESKVIEVVGDGHASIFEVVDSFDLHRLSIEPETAAVIRARIHPLASLSDLKTKGSSSEISKDIEQASKTAPYLVLNLGQIDLELCFYHRKAVIEDDCTENDYVSSLIDIYQNYLSILDIGNAQIALKGANLTAMGTKRFALRYILSFLKTKIPNDENHAERSRTVQANLHKLILTQSDQNAMHLSFNSRLKALSVDLGYSYFDLNSHLAQRNSFAEIIEPRVLANVHQPFAAPPQILPSVEAVHQHYLAATRAFGLM